MPTPEREAQPQPPVTSAVSMKDLLAACAAATAVSTPPSGERQETGEHRASGERPEPEQRDAA
ncbi:hypothetical protein [Streptomyces sp. NBC_00316]|uniref:hypothetical protein n=1 Tax=Streptomyces sp. NBC_00316 TaxID=2975710 RepID=UPI002E27C77C|nr:hypothetical protein [Streptomyces sp. NBC_00316]